ncbi:CBS domain-containing protein [Pyrobaculum neutrophilum]|uniref:Signal-transduction protein with CBS domains n=1 Tax=Pyrobaculum neutrophilum (strain DSM 2338 / JCM 9278 / NBRC 100436 / V24Sta) TaxID=444157 RepID=B1YB42_PYRNV|nr:CBS domain-containing protein [Pyrobaculum neutrophilum]ACB40742.1 putative signal-transduction protein with CBS domains [Pyrobaculum neutrophilum V24Sta]
MNCGDIAAKPPVVVTPDATVEEAAEKMITHRVGLLVVVDKETRRKPIGVVSERDLLKAVAGKMPPTTTVDKVGTMGNYVYVYADDPITVAARKMKQNNVRHVVVLDRGGELYGVISIRDLIGERKVLEILAKEWAPSME